MNAALSRLAFIPLILFLGLVAFFIWGLQQDPHRLPSALLGKKLPDFIEPDLFNPQETLNAYIFQGHYSLLNVFATWCVTCHSEHPILMDIQREAPQLQLVGLDYKDEAEKTKVWLQDYGNPYRWVLSDQTGSLARLLGVYGTPESFLINPEGVIVYKHIGAISPTVWHEEILPLYQSKKKEGR